MRDYVAVLAACWSISVVPAVAQATGAAPPPANTPRCKQFAEGDNLSFTGYLVITDQKHEEEEVNSKPYMFVFLDTPICWVKSPNKVLMTLEVYTVPRTLLGQHVSATGKMVAGDAWSANATRIRFKSER